MDQVIKSGHFTLPYHIYGHGMKTLLAFHGFGRTGEDFQIFERGLGERFTIYAFDLPYHGEAGIHSQQKNPSFTKEDLKELLLKCCEEKNISRFSVMGYSLGGKIALGCVEVLPEKIDGLYLLASDGLKVNPFYFIGTRTWVGRWLFKSIIDNPSPLFGLSNFLEKAKLINPKLNHFVKHHMDTHEKRRQVYEVWVVFRHFIPNLHKIAEHINRNNITVRMFFGKYDNVILPHLPHKLLRKLKNQTGVLHVLNHGHRVMEKSGEICKTILKDS